MRFTFANCILLVSETHHISIWSCDFSILQRIPAVCECVCVCACMVTSLYCSKITASMQQYEGILTPKCYFCATHFRNYWFRNFEKKYQFMQ